MTGAGDRRVYGIGRPGARAHGPVVRVQGIDAGFLEPSYAPGQEAAALISTDAKTLTFQVFAYSGGGLYFLRISAADGRVGYAPFIVKPRALGGHRIAVVLATQTWQAYNFVDSNGDGWGDSWDISSDTHSVDLTRPFLDFGLPLTSTTRT